MYVGGQHWISVYSVANCMNVKDQTHYRTNRTAYLQSYE